MTDILLTEGEINPRQEIRALIDPEIDPGLAERMGSEKAFYEFIRKMGAGWLYGVFFTMTRQVTNAD